MLLSAALMLRDGSIRTVTDAGKLFGMAMQNVQPRIKQLLHAAVQSACHPLLKQLNGRLQDPALFARDVAGTGA